MEQEKALSSQVKALTKEKKEKENVTIDFKLVNLKNISVLQFEELKIKIVEAKKKKLLEEKNEHQRNLQHL